MPTSSGKVYISAFAIDLRKSQSTFRSADLKEGNGPLGILRVHIPQVKLETITMQNDQLSQQTFC